jgi:RNA polymerase sigma-70 factor (ECF subfamily)
MFKLDGPAMPATAELSDHELIARVICQDEDALAALYDRYYRLIFAIGLRVTGDQAVAEEVVQDVFHAVWRTAGGFKPTGNPAAWLVGIARHRAIDATRARGVRARRGDHSLNIALEIDNGLLTEVYVEQRLLGEHVREALRQLSPPQREALELAYYAGLTQAEIAVRVGAPLSTVKTRLRLGLLKLRRCLVV